MDLSLEHPERFVRGQPKVSKLPKAVWINPPKVEKLTAAGSDERISIFSKEDI